ncbi:lipoate--protein ligase family protein [Paenibacillus methanolicus]|uniref:Octanoyl-[GcvH]:protein N-octanoyltransferase n=1 Tax=Paenibacillus methanolicus TaxID=582686 RepID=A0A5S5CJD1_9BACL|nr:biotin--protein ligase [Paenibacillus methanolicus]TYP79123.1 octanoyl-[GcvH]:protein N-octanoyltransferase [Paenibacillus methanolicus]
MNSNQERNEIFDRSETGPSFLIWDRSVEPLAGDVLLPFAYEEWLGREIGQGRLKPGVHIWRHRRGAVLGTRDRKLPEAEEAIRELEGEGWSVGVRNSGGAFVPLDEGVVNVTLLMPNPSGRMEHRADFLRMVRLLSATLDAWGLRAEAGEIAGAYCPGEYDVAVGGRKFCGIAQRRQVRSVNVQAFVVAGGSGPMLAGVAERFYAVASGGLTELDYPRIVTSSMASLDECALEANISADVFVQKLKQVLAAIGGEEAALPEAPAGEVERLAVELRDRYDTR